MVADEWLLWQLADSAFPVGALAHSNGLEAAVQHGLVRDGKSLEEFVRAGIRQNTQGVLGFVKATRQQSEDFAVVDRQCDLFLNSHVANRASRAQGQALLAAVTRIFPIASVLEFSQRVRASQSPAHLAPVFGVVMGLLGVGTDQTESLFTFIFVRGCLGSAVRLGIVGPLEAQRIQLAIRPDSQMLQPRPVQIAPVLDLLQATQDRLYSRLFQS